MVRRLRLLLDDGVEPFFEAALAEHEFVRLPDGFDGDYVAWANDRCDVILIRNLPWFFDIGSPTEPKFSIVAVRTITSAEPALKRTLPNLRWVLDHLEAPKVWVATQRGVSSVKMPEPDLTQSVVPGNQE